MKHFSPKILLVLVIAALAVTAMWSNFSRNAGKSRAGGQSHATIFFEKTSYSITPNGAVDLNVIMQTNKDSKMSAATISLKYPQESFDYYPSADGKVVESCYSNNFKFFKGIKTVDDSQNGILTMSRVVQDSDDHLPSGIFCFYSFTFVPKKNVKVPSTAMFYFNKDQSIWDGAGPNTQYLFDVSTEAGSAKVDIADLPVPTGGPTSSTCTTKNNEIYVAPYAGGEKNCMNDLQLASNVADDGWTIYLASADYTFPDSGEYSINITKKNLTIKGDPKGNTRLLFMNNKGGVLIDGMSGSIHDVTVQGRTTNSLTYITNSSNLVIDNSTFTNLPVDDGSAAVADSITLTGSQSVTLSNLHIKNLNYGLYVYNSTNINIKDNEFSSSRIGVELIQTSGSFMNNYVHDNSSAGLAVWIGESDILTISHNTFRGNKANNEWGGGLTVGTSALKFQTTIEKNTIEKNTYGFTYYSADIVTSSASLIGKTNRNPFGSIKKGSKNSLTIITSLPSTVTMQYNNIWGNQTNYAGIADLTGTNGNISVDPATDQTASCLPANSPLIYGDPAKGEYIGDVPPCSVAPATPTPTVNPNDVNIFMKLKLQGITSKKNVQIPVKITVRGVSLPQAVSSTVNFTADANGIWSGVASFSGITPATSSAKFTILVKGQKHVQKKVCDMVPTETYPGSYRCDDGNITLVQGTNNLDFTGIIQPAGDLPEQDGVVNSYDMSLLRNNLSSTDPAILTVADVNYDGVINAQDYSLVVASLEVRPDE